MDTLTVERLRPGERTCWFIPALVDELEDHVRNNHEGDLLNDTERLMIEGAIRQLQTLLAPTAAVATAQPQSAWLCPIHHTQRTVPAGTSKKTGKDYAAFIVCGEKTCDERPPRVNGQPSAQGAPQYMP